MSFCLELILKWQAWLRELSATYMLIMILYRHIICYHLVILGGFVMDLLGTTTCSTTCTLSYWSFTLLCKAHASGSMKITHNCTHTQHCETCTGVGDALATLAVAGPINSSEYSLLGWPIRYWATHDGYSIAIISGLSHMSHDMIELNMWLIEMQIGDGNK